MGRFSQPGDTFTRLWLNDLVFQMADEQGHGVQRLAQVMTGGRQEARLALAFPLGAHPRRLQ